ncbi:MAG: hypothetical protein R3325_03180, partial [Thermoanaerobaculia bacterium]|nr:hypothetical protein [Thermoanaerobaculia bacterium]
EDGNGAADLGDTWSRPATGRIRVCTRACGGRSPVLEDRYVAVFGGGLDAEHKRSPVLEGPDRDGGDDLYRPFGGNFLYMADLATGQILYKRRMDRLEGLSVSQAESPAMVPSEPAAVDLDQDSYLDTIYVGTTDGYLYKVDLSTPQEIDPASGRVTSPAWEPFRIFDTGGRPVYYPPSVVFVARLGRYALAFGTGDREDLWSRSGQAGRFYLFLDTGFGPATAGLPFDASELEPIHPTATPTPAGADFLLAPDTAAGKRPGWVMTLEADQRVIDRAFALAGLLFFTTFDPDPSIGATGECGSSGASSLFAVYIDSAGGVLPSGRFRTVSDLVTRPFAEPSLGAGGAPPPPGEPTAPSAPCDSAAMDAITRTLKSDLFPEECDFAHHTLNVLALRSESGLECLAPVPICVVRRNWKER